MTHFRPWGSCSPLVAGIQRGVKVGGQPPETVSVGEGQLRCYPPQEGALTYKKWSEKEIGLEKKIT